MGANRDSLVLDGGEGPKLASAASGDALSGSPAPLDSTLPPTPLRDLLAADGAAIFVLSSDRELSRTVEQAGRDRYPIYRVADWTELVGAIVMRRARIVLLDADSLPVALPEAVAALQSAAPEVVVLVAAKREAAQSAMNLISERKVHRLLIKPATDGITRLLLESAVERYLQLRDRPAAPAMLVDEIRPPRRYRRRRNFGSAWALVVAAVVAGTVAVVVVGEMQGLRWHEAIDRLVTRDAEVGGTGETDVPASTEPSSDGRAAGSEPQTALRGAETVEGGPVTVTATDALVAPPAFEAPRSDDPILITPAAPASSAGAEPSSTEAAAASGVDTRRDSPPSSARDSTAAPAAADANARATAVAEPAAGVSAVIERGASVSADRDASAPATPDLDNLLELIDARLADDQVLTPYEDSAVTYFDRAMALRPLDPRLLTRRNAIAARLVDAGHAAIERKDFAEAQRLAEEAFRRGADRAALARLDRELEAARRAETLARHAELVASARALLRQGRLLDADGTGALPTLAALRRERSTDPGLADAWREVTEAVAANVSAAIDAGDFVAARRWASALAIDGGEPVLAAELEFEATQAEYLAMPIAAGELQLIESRPPVYPDDALADGIEGWVDVEYIVDREGRPRDIVVIDSRPGRRFVDAAVEAIGSHRYVPFLLDGRVYERRVRVRVRFELQ